MDDKSMPPYNSPVRIQAVQIKSVTILNSGHVILEFMSDKYAPLRKSEDWRESNRPRSGDYFANLPDTSHDFVIPQNVFLHVFRRA